MDKVRINKKNSKLSDRMQSADQGTFDKKFKNIDWSKLIIKK